MDLLIEDIKKIVCETLNIQEIAPEDPLFEKGIDSMNMLIVLNEIEIFFNIIIPDEELLISNFETVERISELVWGLRREY